MSLRFVCNLRGGDATGSFNLTPLIDIVFLLIIFFLVVCRFIEAENFPVDVPQGCESAQSGNEPGMRVTTVTVTRGAQETVTFAVGAETVSPSDLAAGRETADRLAQLIDASLRDLPPDARIVTLRIDSDISFAHAQHALEAVALSSATNVRLAVIRDKLETNGRLLVQRRE